MLLGITEYAKHRGLRLQAVQKAVAKGHIRRNAAGYIDTEEADRAWKENVREYEPAEPEPEPCMAAKVATEGEGVVATAAVPGMTFNQARTLTQYYIAQRTKLDVEKKQGLLVYREEVAQRAEKLYREYRDRLLELPARLATILAAESDPNRVLQILDDELRRILIEFSEAK